MRAQTSWLLLLAASNTACLRQTAFHCTSDLDCSGGGMCVVGYCAFADSSCAGGQRFGDSAGPNAGQCVGANGDGGIDAMVDSPLAPGCPSGYVNAGSQPHMYKVVTMQHDWMHQRDDCAATKPGGGAYLAIPDDAAELSAIDNLVGGNSEYWLGIDDMATPGVYLNAKGTTQTFLPWGGGQPDMGPPPKNCVKDVANNNEFATDRCNTTMRAVCECEP